MILELLAVFLLRAGQAIALALPTVLAGMLAAGVIEVWIGRPRMKRWLDSGNALDLPRAWLMAMLLPVCALGMLPVLWVVWRMRVRMGAIVVVALAGPVLTPWTIGYMLDCVGWKGMIILLLANLTISLSAAWVAQRVRGVETTVGDVPPPPLSGSRLVDCLAAAGRSLTRGVAMLIVVSSVGAGALAVMMPPNAMGEWLVEREAIHALLLTFVPLMTYVPPHLTAMQAGEVLNASTMPGLLIPIIAVGSGVTLGLIAAGVRMLGVRPTVATAAVVVVLTVLLAGTADRLLYDSAYEPDDTHAFEDAGRPFHMLDHPGGALPGFANRFARPLQATSVVSAVMILLLVLHGRTHRGDAPAASLPSYQLRLGMIVFVIGTAIISVYSYLPAPATLAREIQIMSAELIDARRAADLSVQTRTTSRLRHRLSQLPACLLLRGRSLDADQRQAIEEFQSLLAQSLEPSTTTRLSDQEVRYVKASNRVVATLR